MITCSEGILTLFCMQGNALQAGGRLHFGAVHSLQQLLQLQAFVYPRHLAILNMQRTFYWLVTFESKGQLPISCWKRRMQRCDFVPTATIDRNQRSRRICADV